MQRQAGRVAGSFTLAFAEFKAHAVSNRFDFLAEQWWGSDANADGFGNSLASSGGYARLKYYPRELFTLLSATRRRRS